MCGRKICFATQDIAADSPQINTVLTRKKPDRMLQCQFFDPDKPRRASTSNKNKY
ncbi:hypothetical protein HMPREF1981_03533 [Bacteroides pyogenes F0041]|uniref:Uncharacterized protein n=1 Tax=Bacteroides pyogenes F0041 TaxID=1321819 RepID=U2DMM9_9BACE|nr:hypothetical protein HMPREF1981_03533 [Bacteroides pyogenes F0041]